MRKPLIWNLLAMVRFRTGKRKMSPGILSIIIFIIIRILNENRFRSFHNHDLKESESVLV